MGNVACGSNNETGIKTLNNFLTKYKQYNTLKQDKSKSKSSNFSDDLRTYENIINDHYKQFIVKKNEMEIINPNLYKLFFKDNVERSLEVKNISKDDESKFFYFLNLRTSIKEIKIQNSQILFPSFGARYFPKYNLDNSTIEKITINESEIVFRDNFEDYNRIKSIIGLDLSYNNIISIPIHFKRFYNIEYLYLKRNKLKSLDLNYDLRLKDLDLSENEFTKIPDFVFALKFLVKLNLNSNELTEFSITKENRCLEYLYLVNNKFSKIPIEINYFRSLKHLALDSNKIVEINVNIFKEDLSLKITLSSNDIIGVCPGLDKNILTLPIPKVISEKATGNKKNESIDLKVEGGSNIPLNIEKRDFESRTNLHSKNQSTTSFKSKSNKKVMEINPNTNANSNKIDLIKETSEDDKIEQLLEEAKYKNCKYFIYIRYTSFRGIS